VGEEEADFQGTDRYEVLGTLGEGGQGWVYRVRDRKRGMELALKRVKKLGGQGLYELKREYRIRQGIHHPGLVRLVDLHVPPPEDPDGDAFFTMDIVEGTDFLRWLWKGTRRPAEFRPTAAVVGEDGHTLTDPGASLTSTESDPPGGLRSPRVDVDASGFDSRLRNGFAQLVEALSALHRQGVHHRDVKPANTRVTADDRIVLVDFGLSSRIPSWERPDRHGLRAAGTVDYMAPEQARNQTPTPAVDLYAVGAMLFQALTGRLPFRGAPKHILEFKQQHDAPYARSVSPEVPRDLADLARDLLHRDPLYRPAAEEVLDRLAARTQSVGDFGIEDETGEVHVTLPLVQADGRVPFVGRGGELAAMRHAWEQAAGTGRLQVVHVVGESGIGKTATVGEFLGWVRRKQKALVFQGRCRLHESVPYKALDAVIDGVAARLARVRPDAVDELLPDHRWELTRIFPVLGRLESFEGVSAPEHEPEPAVVRRRGIKALRVLLERLSRIRPFVAWIDDLQWTDRDSLDVLRELVRGPNAPQAVLVLSYRAEDLEGDSLQTVRSLDGLRIRDDHVHEIRLGALADAELLELAGAVLDTQQPDFTKRAGQIIRDCGGSPFFAGQLALHASSWAEGASEISLGNVVLQRVSALPPTSRRLLDVVSVLGRTTAEPFVLEAAGAGRGDELLLAELADARLIRRTSTPTEEAVAPYHDKLTESVLGVMDPTDRRSIHRSIAESLEGRPTLDLESLYRHWRGAQDQAKAGGYAVRAADRAAEALAFDRAADLYERALELLGGDADRAALLRKLADALANRGRGEEAGRRYEEAAAASEGHAGRLEILRVRRWAAEQYLQAGAYERGMQIFRGVLQDLGIRIPKRPMLVSIFGRLWLLLRGLRHRDLPESEVPAETLHRLDALWGAGTRLAPINHGLADSLGVLYMLEALRAGDRLRVARAILNESVWTAGIGGPVLVRRYWKLMARGRALAAHSNEPYDRGFVMHTEGTAAWHRGDWARAARLCTEAAQILSNGTTGTAWEVDWTNLYALSARTYLGDVEGVARDLEATHERALDRGDLLAANNFRLGVSSIARLLTGRVDDALDLAERARRTWPTGTYHSQRYQYVMFMTQAALFRGRPWEARSLMEEAWPRLRAAAFLKLEVPRVELAHLRGRAALGAACSPAPPSTEATGTAGLLRTAAAAARTVSRSATAPAAPLATLLKASIAALKDSAAASVDHQLAAAEVGFEGAGMGLYREVVAAIRVARRTNGVLRPQGPATEAVTDLPAAVAMLAPGRWT